MPLDSLRGFFKRLTGAGKAGRSGTCCGGQCSARLIAAKDVPEGRAVCVKADGRDLAVFRQGDRYFALANRCSHLGGPLCKGQVADGTVTCPWHGAKFGISTGKVLGGPAKKNVESLELEVRGEDLYFKKGSCEERAD